MLFIYWRHSRLVRGTAVGQRTHRFHPSLIFLSHRFVLLFIVILPFYPFYGELTNPHLFSSVFFFRAPSPCVVRVSSLCSLHSLCECLFYHFVMIIFASALFLGHGTACRVLIIFIYYFASALYIFRAFDAKLCPMPSVELRRVRVSRVAIRSSLDLDLQISVD